MSTQTTSTCKNHRKREAVTTCAACGSPVCSECVVRTPVGFKCRDCVGGAPEGRRAARTSRRPGRARPKGRWMLVVSASVAAVGLIAYLAVSRGGENSAGPAGSGLGIDQQESAVVFEGAGDVRIAGSLSLPAPAGEKRVPAVLIVPGFGPTNRNGVTSAGTGGMPDLLYQEISQTLTEAGIASLRYDKRGAGASRLPDRMPLMFEDMMVDAESGLKFLRQRKEIDPARTAIVGHDEGGLIAMRVADRDSQVRSVVLISTPGRPLLDVLTDDLVNSAPPDNPAMGTELAARLTEEVGRLMETGRLPAPESLPSQIQGAFPPGSPQYVKTIFSIDPVEEAGKVTAPTLVVVGARSNGVRRVDGDALKAAMGSRAELLIGERANSTLRIPLAVAPGAGGSTDEHAGAVGHGGGVAGGDRRDQELLDRTVDWLRRQLA